MEMIEVIYTGIHPKVISSPGYRGIPQKDDIINVSKAEFEKELKDYKNENGEPLFVAIKKKTKKESTEQGELNE